MKKILIINGHQPYEVVAKGELTQKYIDTANDFFLKKGYEVKQTHIDKGYDVNDGRSRKDKSKKYGSGGLFKNKKYMLSITYNCPASEFSNKDSFFEGLTLDEAHVAVHKSFQFCGMEKLETYSVHDILKGDLDLDFELNKFTNILESNF